MHPERKWFRVWEVWKEWKLDREECALMPFNEISLAAIGWGSSKQAHGPNEARFRFWSDNSC